MFWQCRWHHELTPQRTSSSHRTLKVQKTVHQAAEGGVSNGNKCSKSSSPKAAANGSLQPRLCSAECRAGRGLCQCQCKAIRAMAGSAFLSHKVCILCYRVSYPTLNCLAFPSFKKNPKPKYFTGPTHCISKVGAESLKQLQSATSPSLKTDTTASSRALAPRTP